MGPRGAPVSGRRLLLGEDVTGHLRLPRVSRRSDGGRALPRAVGMPETETGVPRPRVFPRASSLHPLNPAVRVPRGPTGLCVAARPVAARVFQKHLPADRKDG